MSNIERLRKELQEYMDKNLQSRNYYARQIGIASWTLRDFLYKTESTPQPLTIGKILKFLKEEGVR